MIEINKLSVSFDEKQVFNGLDLSLEDGIACIMGESGCGKTTLLRTIAGLKEPLSGTITPTFSAPSICFQEDRLFPWLNAEENVAIGTIGEQHFKPIIEPLIGVADIKERIGRTLELLELGNELKRFPNELSGGQQRRIALARALVYGGDVLILDEPFKGLDDELVERICPLFHKITVPTIIATHNEKIVDLLGGKSVLLKML